MVGNAADPEQVREAEEDVRLTRAQEIADIQAILATPGGRRTLWRWLDGAHVTRPVWHADAARRDYQAGSREYALAILDEIKEASFDSWLLMQKEARQRELARGQKKRHKAKDKPEKEDEHE